MMVGEEMLLVEEGPFAPFLNGRPFPWCPSERADRDLNIVTVTHCPGDGHESLVMDNLEGNTPSHWVIM